MKFLFSCNMAIFFVIPEWFSWESIPVVIPSVIPEGLCRESIFPRFKATWIPDNNIRG